MGRKFRKDTNAPKKPLTTFMRWSIQTRPQVNADNPGASIGDIGRLLGAAWKDVSDEAKAGYKAAYEGETPAYQSALAEYKQTSEYADYTAAKSKFKQEWKKKSGGKKLKAMLVNMPKRNQSGYMRFSQANRGDYTGEGVAITEVMKRVGLAWGALSDAEKKPYNDAAAEGKVAYDAAMAEYKQSDEYATYKEAAKAHRKANTPAAARRAEKEKAKAAAAKAKEKAKAGKKKAAASAKKTKERAKASAKKEKVKASRAKARARASGAKEKKKASKAKATAKKKAAGAKKKEKRDAAKARKQAISEKKKARKQAASEKKKAKKSAKAERKRAGKRKRSEKKAAKRAAKKAKK